MINEVKLSSEEISRRIIVGMGLVYDLYNELVGFLRRIREEIENSDFDASSLMGSNFKLPLGNPKHRTRADNYLAVDLGLVFALGVIRDEGGDDEDEGEVADEELEKKGVRILPDSQFLAIRVLLYDRREEIGSGFAPIVTVAVLGGLKRESLAKKSAAAPDSLGFEVRRNQFLGLAKQLDSNCSQRSEIRTRITKGELTATVSEIQHRPLGNFQSESDLMDFLSCVKQMVKIGKA